MHYWPYLDIGVWIVYPQGICKMSITAEKIWFDITYFL